ncbi:MAG TPA: DUF1501 domain-containing protein [Terriglobia bacterium]|nr:DUF1501 domain-containing protein [Terriglobia bacterium]
MRKDQFAEFQRRSCGRQGRFPAVFSRRNFLAGGLSGVGYMLLSAGLEAQSGPAVKTQNTARACIYINLEGGPSHLDTFDPKDGPWNPRDADLRQHPGGILLSQRFFPILSSLTSELCVLRSVSSWELAHSRGQFYVQTGHKSNPAFAADTPHIGAVVAYERKNTGALPPFVSFGNGSDEQRQGFLPGSTAPFSFYPNPGGLYNLRHDFYGNQSKTFFEQSFALLGALDAPLRQRPLSAEMAAYSEVQNQARALVYNDAVEGVFKFSNADDARYGGTNIGRSLIIARNLVRSKLGTVFINVTQSGWDIHAQQFNKQANMNIYRQTGELDRALGNLILDLRVGGDLSSTLIAVLGEFGRTPGPLNSRDGRDHYRAVMSAVLAGGGVRGGRAIGASDEMGGFITDSGWAQDRSIYPEDIVATIYSALGIQWTKSLEGALSGRRFSYIVGAEEGLFMPIQEVFV